jgi:hypothetical protein
MIEYVKKKGFTYKDATGFNTTEIDYDKCRELYRYPFKCISSQQKMPGYVERFFYKIIDSHI